MASFGQYMARTATLAGAGAVTMTVVGLVAVNIATTIVPPGDPLWVEVLCKAGIPFEGDEQCFAKRLKEGLNKIESEFDKKREELEQRHEQREQDLDLQIKKKQKEVAGLEQQRDGLEKDKAEIVKAREEMASRLKAMEAIESRVTTFNLFTHKPWKGRTVTTGVEYTSFVRSQEWAYAWCYFNVRTYDGMTLQVEIATQKAGASVKNEEVKESELAAGKMTQVDVEDARTQCSFPSAGM